MDKPGKRWRVSAGQIKNKSKRMEIYAKQRKEKEEAKAARRAARQKEREVAEAAGEAVPAKLEPRTLDNTREFDDTFVTVDDVEVAADEAEDEFAAYFSGDKVPKLMITTRPKPSKQVFPLISELMRVIPNMQYFKRGENTLKKMSAVAMEKGFTHLLVLNQRGKLVSKLIICHLPMGPSAAFRLTSEQLSWMIRGHGRSTSHVPEIILNNFKTRLGHRVGRLLGSLFPHVRDADGGGDGSVLCHTCRSHPHPLPSPFFLRRTQSLLEGKWSLSITSVILCLCVSIAISLLLMERYVY